MGQHVFFKQISKGQKLFILAHFHFVSFWEGGGQSCESCKKRNAWKDIF